ncbi:MAG: cytochrome c [Nitrospiraceae bacterium]|nr:MAG: cytochrome c [Nitrospiraceae bacterium]
MFSMFEVLGRREKKYSIDNLKRVHRISGYVYILSFLTITYFCLHYIASAKTELSSRASLHSFIAVTILALLGIKLSFIRIYRQSYDQVRYLGIAIAILTFGLVSLSGGYHMLISKFGTDTSFNSFVQYKATMNIEKDKNKKILGIIIDEDAEGIGRGKNLFDSKCSFCHEAYSAEYKVGPGLKRVLKNARLPVSNKPALPENIIKQIKQPFNRMPSFEYLTDEEIDDLLAFLNTL